MRVSASASNFLRYFVLVDTYDGNPVLQKFVVRNGESISLVVLFKDWLFISDTITTAPKIFY